MNVEDQTPKVTELLDKVAAVLNKEGEIALLEELDLFVAMIIRNMDEVNSQNAELRADIEAGKPYFELDETHTIALAKLLIYLQRNCVLAGDINTRQHILGRIESHISQRDKVIAKLETQEILTANDLEFIRVNIKAR